MGLHKERVDHKVLQTDCTEFLGEDVEAVGVFDVHLNFAERDLAPAVAGVAGYTGTRLVEEKTDHDGFGAKTGAAAAGVLAFAGTRHLMYIEVAKEQGLTPMMIVAVTKNQVYLLDWKGSHENGEGPTRILFDFDRSHETKIKCHTKNITHHVVDIHHHHGHTAQMECKLGHTHRNKKMNREVIDLLKDHHHHHQFFHHHEQQHQQQKSPPSSSTIIASTDIVTNSTSSNNDNDNDNFNHKHKHTHKHKHKQSQ